MERPFHTLDVFTDTAYAGNPLAVLPDGDGLTDAQMQQVASEFNLSETTFVQAPGQGSDAVARVRIFTPEVELPFAGHPTVGTALLLCELGRVPAPASGDGETTVVLAEGVGEVPVRVVFSDGRARYAELSVGPQEAGPTPPDVPTIAAVLSLAPEDVADGPWAPVARSCGVPFVLVSVRDIAALERIRLDTARWRAHLSGAWAEPLYVVAPSGGDETFRARMFAPGTGVDEDPATGSAASALAGFLAESEPDGTATWTVRQGVEMGRPSTLHLSADIRDGQVTRIRVGGSAVRVADGTILVP